MARPVRLRCHALSPLQGEGIAREAQRIAGRSSEQVDPDFSNPARYRATKGR